MTEWAKVMREDWDCRDRLDPLRHMYRKPDGGPRRFFHEGKDQAIALTAPLMRKFRFNPRPSNLRAPAQSTYHLDASSWSKGPPHRSLEAHYAAGHLETWLEAAVTPGHIINRLARLGMASLTVCSSPLDSSDGKTFGAAGRKPGDGRAA